MVPVTRTIVFEDIVAIDEGTWSRVQYYRCRAEGRLERPLLQQRKSDL